MIAKTAFIREIREIRGQIKTAFGCNVNDDDDYLRDVSVFSNTPTRYESVGCDDENFSSLKEYEFTRLHGLHESGTTLRPCGLRDETLNLTQTSQNTQTTHTQACAGHPEGN